MQLEQLLQEATDRNNELTVQLLEIQGDSHTIRAPMQPNVHTSDPKSDSTAAGDELDHIALLRLKLEAGKISEHEYNHFLACYNALSEPDQSEQEQIVISPEAEGARKRATRWMTQDSEGTLQLRTVGSTVLKNTSRSNCVEVA